jgi:hypothetical protein
MQKLYFSPTRYTPEIILSPDENVYLIRGNSSPEDVRALYYPVTDWLRNFSTEVLKKNSFTLENPMRFTFDLRYFNSSSAKFIFDILTELKALRSSGIPVIIEWYYEEDDIDVKEAGDDISSIANIEFVFIEKKGS